MTETEYKAYGESKIEILYGWYSVAEIKEMLKTIEANEDINKKMFKKSIPAILMPRDNK